MPSPVYTPVEKDRPNNIALAVESMKQHMSDEGWQIMAGLESAGYHLSGYGLDGQVDVVQLIHSYNPQVVVVQDKCEWDVVKPGDFREPLARFLNVDKLATCPDIFKVAVAKDIHYDVAYRRAHAAEIGCHAWIIYYHPKVVMHLLPFMREQHLIRTTHSVDPKVVPQFTPASQRHGCLLSGAISGAYPFRAVLRTHLGDLPDTTYLRHPGYNRNGCCTPKYLQELSKHKVAICTSSKWGHLFRKIIEATACGCIVVTDLPDDDIAPYIDGNLVRVSPNIKPAALGDMIRKLYDVYDEQVQRDYAAVACLRYDYKVVGARLAQDIEDLRRRYQ